MKKKPEILLLKKAEAIPNGGVYLQQVLCGKKTCRCARLGEKHRAFYFLVRVNGKQRKKYVRKDDVVAMQSLVESARRLRTEFRTNRHNALLIYRAIRDFVSSVNAKE